ncbi:asparagine synthase (glutamine-hydrolyzing) [Candidatus Magnetaquiglobus chichijimensis]
MCGLAGALSSTPHSTPSFVIGQRMAQALTHRGPDDEGIWHDDPQGILLCHRRLSILDPSPAGHQPMHSQSGRYIMTYNGEIYNHTDLRDKLSSRTAITWRGHSDTETLLMGFEQWGILETIKKTIGMFAAAVWDRQDHTLTLFRDRLGEKPLYYGWQGNAFLFASELKAIRTHPAFANKIERRAVELFLKYQCIPTPWSIYQGIFKLRPGTLLTVSADLQEPRILPYWHPLDIMRTGQRDPFPGHDIQAIDALETLLKDAVHRQMLSDVPLGAFLSGGIDSSTVVALMQCQSVRPVKTFTISFAEQQFDEAYHARQVASHLGTEHTELLVTPEHALAVIPELGNHYDEPFADSSQIPTLLLSKLTRSHVTVALSGDAGDELFGGYTRYAQAHTWWNRIKHLPLPLRRGLSQSIQSISPATWDKATHPIFHLLPTRWHLQNAGDKFHKGAVLLECRNHHELYHALISQWHHSRHLLKEVLEPELRAELPAPLQELDAWHHMMAMDMLHYLPDDILVKVDRAAMGVSLETRVPFLDHRVVEFAWRLPLALKWRHGQGKWILRKVLERHLPVSLIDRPKMGFGIPLQLWLQGPLRDWAEGLLNERELDLEGYFDAKAIRQKWNEHCHGDRNWSYSLWSILMFQSWLKNSRSVMDQT